MVAKNLLLPALVSALVSCSYSELPKTELGIEVDAPNLEDLAAEIDCHYLDIEEKLGYDNTKMKLVVEIVEADWCQRSDGTWGYCFYCPYSLSPTGKCNGVFIPPSYGRKAITRIHNGNGTIPLEKTALRFELNRYFKYMHDSEDWDCVDYGVEPPNCFDGYVREYDGRCNSDASLSEDELEEK